MRFTTPAALALALAACGDAGEPLGPDAVASTAGPTPQHAAAISGDTYDDAAAKAVVDDLLDRVLPTLTAGAARDALRINLEALAAALIEPDVATLREYVDTARESLRSYGRTAPSAEEPELEGVDGALDVVSEGLSRPARRPAKR